MLLLSLTLVVLADVTADQLLYKSFPDDIAVKEIMGLSPER